MKVDLDDYLFQEDSETYKERLIALYGEELISPIVKELEEKDLFNWIDVLYENRKEILDTDNIIGTEGFDIEDLLEYDTILEYLIKSDKAEWNDANKFSYILYNRLAEAIEERFSSTKEAVEFITETSEEVDELMEMLEETRNNPLISSEFKNDLALMFAIHGDLSEVEIVEWKKDNIEEYDYILLTVEKDEYDKTGKVAMKIENINKDKLYKSDVLEKSEEDIEDDVFLKEYIDYIEVYTIAYEDEVLELYNEHKYATKDKDELGILQKRQEDNIEFLKENPLPL